MVKLEYGFLTTLNTRKVAEAGSLGRARWRLLNDLAYNSELWGLIVVDAGFETDFASVPRAPLTYWLAGDTAHASAVVHDYLCRQLYPSRRITWRQAADIFREAMRYEFVPAWRRTLMYWAVLSADPANKWSDES